jgi:hypothetical protein
MKVFFSVLLALLTFANLAKADRIVVYEGSQDGTTNNALTGIVNYFWLFDLDTLQFNDVTYSGAGSNKTYSVGTAAPFIYEPITSAPNLTRTYFEYGSSNMSATFSLGFEYFVGDDSFENLGGTFTGDIPTRLTFKSYSIAGNGTTGGDTASLETGVYTINLDVTRESNASNDDLTAATTIITAALTKAGYMTK